MKPSSKPSGKPSGKRPLRIGISACFFHADPERAIFKGKTLLYLEQSLVHWVMSEGALAYLIPSVGGATGLEPSISLRDLIHELDGLVLQGGSDVSPSSYGEQPLRPEWSGDAIRDHYEIALLQEFMNQDKPVLGVCRGAQLINVALGGTLYQDIGTQLPEAINHRNWDLYDQNFHEIVISPDTHLAQLYHAKSGEPIRATTNTIHHQALKELGNHLIPEAHSEKDRLIEAIRLDPVASGGRYVFAAQWHPEFQDPRDLSLLDSRPILTDFLTEVRKRID